MKIKITGKEIEIEGKIEQGRVTPFGTSAHIPSRKEHLGKVVSVIFPENGKYIWVLSEKDKIQFINEVKKNIKNEDGRSRHYLNEEVEQIQGKEFELDSLLRLIDLVDDKVLKKKIENVYNLKEDSK